MGVSPHRNLLPSQSFGETGRDWICQICGPSMVTVTDKTGIMQQQIMLHALAALGSGNPENIRHKLQILETREIFIEIRIVREIGHAGLAPLRMDAQIFPVNQDGSRVIAVDSGDGFERGGFAGTVLSDEGKEIAFFHMKAQIGNAFVGAISCLVRWLMVSIGIPPVRALILSLFYIMTPGYEQELF